MEKVLVFTTTIDQIGGYERLAIELAVELNAQGVHTDILCQYSNKLRGYLEYEKSLYDAGIPKVSFLGLPINPSLKNILIAALRLRRLVNSEKYTAIEISGFTPALLTALALPGLKIKVLMGIHCNYTKRLHSGLRYDIWKRLLKFAYFIKFYAITCSVRDDWLAFTNIDSGRIFLVPNSINPVYFRVSNVCGNTFLRKEISKVPTARYILFVGRLMKSKGVDILYESLKNHLVSNNLVLIYVGRGDKLESKEDYNMLNYIMKDLPNSPWHDRVRFLGHRSDVPELMAASDILVHPARHEGFGLVIAEALAIGIPVVASNVDGIPEVTAGTDSILVPPCDPAALKDAVLDVLNWPKEKRLLAILKGKKRAEQFNVSIRARTFISFFNMLAYSSTKCKNH